MLQLMPTSNSITVSSLSAFTVYVCTIAATTSVGSGPFSDEIAVQTLAEGMYETSSCMEYRTSLHCL